jgi:Polyketide cyclase / dehydrase and lipid transport
MKWFLAVLAGLAAVVLLVVLIGMTLPTAHVATRRARFRQTPQQVFDAISGPPDWRPDISRVERLDPVGGRERWKEFDHRGDAILYELVESAPPLRRSVRIADDSLPFGGTWTFDVIPVQGGSLLRVTENGEVRNPLFRFVSKYIIGHTRSIEDYLKNLGKKFNESIVIEEESKPWDKAPTATPS